MENTEYQFNHIRYRLNMTALSRHVTTVFISGQDQSDDQPNHQNHNFIVIPFEYSWTQMSSGGAMAIA